MNDFHYGIAANHFLAKYKEVYSFADFKDSREKNMCATCGRISILLA